MHFRHRGTVPQSKRVDGFAVVFCSAGVKSGVMIVRCRVSRDGMVQRTMLGTSSPPSRRTVFDPVVQADRLRKYKRCRYRGQQRPPQPSLPYDSNRPA